jgi:hypothetical protein
MTSKIDYSELANKIPVLTDLGLHHPIITEGVDTLLEVKVIAGDFIISRGYTSIPGQISITSPIPGTLKGDITSILVNLVENNDGSNYEPSRYRK